MTTDHVATGQLVDLLVSDGDASAHLGRERIEVVEIAEDRAIEAALCE